MERYRLKEKWASLVRQFKDKERTYDVPAYTTERMAMDILDHIRYTRIRQYNLFTQHRGEEYEHMINLLKTRYTEEAIERFVQDEEIWKTTLTLGEQ
jgi:hypothetical protein